MQAAISTRHLTKVYGDRTIAVNDMSLEIPAGVVFGLLGPNGAGKTTTLRLLLGLQRPTAGTAAVLGQRCGPNAVGVRRMIGYLPTNPKLPGNLRPIEYLDLLGQLCGLSAAVRKPRLTSLLRAVGCPTRLQAHGIAREDYGPLIEQVNVERLANNPRALDGAALAKLLLTIE